MENEKLKNNLKPLLPAVIISISIFLASGIVYLGLLKVADSWPYSLDVDVKGSVDADVRGSISTY